MANETHTPDMPETNILGKKLAKLIGNHTKAEIDLSWKGTRPVEEHHELYQNAAKAVYELVDFCRNELGIILEGDEQL